MCIRDSYPAEQLFKGVPCVDDDILPFCPDPLREGGEYLRLSERLPSAERDPLEHRVFEKILRHLVDGDQPPACKVMGFGIVAAGTVVGTALGLSLIHILI